MILRIKILLLASICCVTILLSGCSDDDLEEVPVSFLADLRPRYFEQLNFESRATVLELPNYVKEFTTTFINLENDYNQGKFISRPDIENMKVVSMYYSFLLTAITRAYLDEIIVFEDIIGDSESTALFSNADFQDSNFEKIEMHAIMQRSLEVAQLGMEIDEDDRLYGCYLAAKQIKGRLDNGNNQNEAAAQMEMIQYVNATISDFNFFPLWNLVISQPFLDNYNDPINTFANPAMNMVYSNLVNRLNPAFLPVNSQSFNSILAPMYHFDIALKKADWAIQNNIIPTPQVIGEISEYIQRMETVSQNIQVERQDVLNTWDHKNTFDQRVEKLQEIKTYMNGFSSGSNPEKPLLAPFINTKDFKQAYQCYSCHKSPNL